MPRQSKKVKQIISNISSLETQKKNIEKVLEDSQSALEKINQTNFSKGVEKLTLDSLHSLGKLKGGSLETPTDAIKQYVDLKHEQNKTREDLQQLDQSIWLGKIELVQEKVAQLSKKMGLKPEKALIKELEAAQERVREWLKEESSGA